MKLKITDILKMVVLGLSLLTPAAAYSSECNIGVHAGGATPGTFRFHLNQKQEASTADSVTYFLPVVESLTHSERTCPYGTCACGHKQEVSVSVRWVPVDQYYSAAENSSGTSVSPPPIAPDMLRKKMGYSFGAEKDLNNLKVQLSNVFKLGVSRPGSVRVEATKIYEGLKNSFNSPVVEVLYRGLISATIGSSNKMDQVKIAFSRYTEVIENMPTSTLESKPAALDAFRQYFSAELNR